MTDDRCQIPLTFNICTHKLCDMKNKEYKLEPGGYL